MKIWFYGASVTAQSKEGAYFYEVEKQLVPKGHGLRKLGFGGSSFDAAGFAFLPELLADQPDIVVLDWLTPNFAHISVEKLKAFFSFLVSHNILPVWIHFPRADDLQHERPCYKQVYNLCYKHKIPFYCLTEDKRFKEKAFEPTQYLRDVVHTNDKGGKLYADYVIEKLTVYLESKLDDLLSPLKNSLASEKLKYFCPQLQNKKSKITINNLSKTNFDIDTNNVNTKVNVELFLELQIGPQVGILYVEIRNTKTNELVKSFERNPVDPWCYYSRRMLIPLTQHSISMLPGNYQISIKLLDRYPFNSVELREDNPEPNFDNSKRWSDIYRLSVVTSLPS